MQNLILIIVVGLLGYFVFSRKGEVGCCSHGAHVSRRHQERQPAESADNHQVNVIDLDPDEYTIIATVPIDSPDRRTRH